MVGPVIARNKTSFTIDCTKICLSKLLNVSEEAFALLLLENGFLRWRWTAESTLDGFHNCSSNSTIGTSMPPLQDHCSVNEDNDSYDNNYQDTNVDDDGGDHVNKEDDKSVQINNVLNDDFNNSQSSTADSLVTSEAYYTDNCDVLNIGPPYRYQQIRVRKDNKPGAGPWNDDGMRRLNDIVAKIVECRKGREDFELSLLQHFKNKQKLSPMTLKRKMRNETDTNNDDNDRSKKVVVIDLFSESI